MPIGLPASGKSTFYKGLKARFNDAVMDVSFDNALDALAAKKEISYAEAFELSRNDKEAKKFVDDHYKAQLERAMFHNGIVFIDQTNLTQKGRDAMLSKFKSFYKVGVYFNITAEESKRRCRMRYLETGKKIADHVVDNMARNAKKNKPDPMDFDMFIEIDTQRQLNRYETVDNLVKSAQINTNLPRP